MSALVIGGAHIFILIAEGTHGTFQSIFIGPTFLELSRHFTLGEVQGSDTGAMYSGD